MTDWLAANWFGIATFIAGSILTVIVSFIFKNRKTLKVKIEHSEVITKSDDNLPGIEIRYHDKPVDRLSKTTFTIWNCGNSIITKDDIVEIDPLRCELDKEAICLVDKDSVSLGRKACNAGIDANIVPFTIFFDFLDKRDGLTFAIIHNSVKKPKIAGVLRGTKISENKSGLSIYENITLIIASAIFFFLLGIFDKLISSGIYIEYLIFFGVIVLLSIFIKLASVLIRKSDPKSIIKRFSINN